MPKAEILKIMDAVRAVIAMADITDEEAAALLLAIAKAVRPKRKRKSF